MAKHENGEAGRGRWTEREARAALEELALGGESEVAFARRHGFSTQRLRYWRKQLIGTTRSVAAKKKSAFVAIAMPHARASAKIEIRLGDVTVAVREDLDAEQLARIVAALAHVRQC